MEKEKHFGLSRVLNICSEYFGFSRSLSILVVGVVGFIICFAIYWFVHSAPPRTLTITSGPPGSMFERYATRYRDILARNGVKLNILPSRGSLENLQRLLEATNNADIGFVQGGIAGTNVGDLVSLGSIAYQPLLIFYRGANPITMLSQLDGKRLAVGTEGSGARALTIRLLQTNGLAITANTNLLALDTDEAVKAFLSGSVDAVFVMGDSASMQAMRSLLRSPGAQLMSFEQADAYTRRFNFLNKLRLPEGSFDFGKNLPAQDLWLIGPTVELVARPGLNTAVSDLVLEAVHETHGNAGLFQNQNEFPAALMHEYPISADAQRYYKSGKTFLYREFPFWIASIVNRVLVAFVPVIIVLIPGLRLIPWLYRWRIQLRIYRWYRKLLVLERQVTTDSTPAAQHELAARLNEIENVVKHLKVPASFASQFYWLRGHIDYVREKLAGRMRSGPK